MAKKHSLAAESRTSKGKGAARSARRRRSRLLPLPLLCRVAHTWRK